jgi:hypothetical protein
MEALAPEVAPFGIKTMLAALGDPPMQSVPRLDGRGHTLMWPPFSAMS